MVKRILVVDDSELILKAARRALEGAGFEVETRVSVADVGKRGAVGFDLILMDVQMPELYGDDVAAVLKDERGILTPIYLFSTLDEDELAQRAKDAGVAGWISKQRGMGHLVERVTEILAK